jgi:2-polyprenyl-6-methoxyphenol hydroxylase-like FAD-dependent oxidoreductase
MEGAAMARPHFNTQCCIVGGGPAGMMLGYLLARAGVATVVLEKHADFLRDFRGDTIHPSTLELMRELGLLDAFLKLPHSELTELTGTVGSARLALADFSRIKTHCKFIALMPQWDFLNFLAAEAQRLPDFTLIMSAEAQDLVRQGDRVIGVQADTSDGPLVVNAILTVAADGRHSILRSRAQLAVRDIGAPIDVLWFRVARDPSAEIEAGFGHIAAGKVLVTLDRGDYWQCAYVIPKGTVEAVKARGLDAFRRDVGTLAPALQAHVGDVRSWDDVKLLSVAIDRLEHWAIPGLLCIGDAAHAMSPIGGVGINLAVQDAVATANLLADPLRDGRLTDTAVARIQRRRAFPMRIIQALQVQIQNRVLQPAISSSGAIQPPLALRLIARSRWLRGLVASVVGVGIRPEHIRSADRRSADG